MSTNNQIDAEAQKDPEELEREIDEQRSEIGNIVHALENKLSPGELIDTALGYVKGGGGEFFGNLSNTVKANPVPTLLTSVGLVWLMAGQNRQPRPVHSSSNGPSLTDKFSGKASSLKQQGAGMKSKAGEMRTRASESSRHAADNLRNTAGRARGGFNQLLNEQPLALGAIGIAFGALLAASMPPTRREDELMGHARDNVTGKLKAKAEEGYEQARAVGEDVASQAKRDMGGGEAQPASGPH